MTFNFKKSLKVALVTLITIFITSTAFSASPDGSEPWADSIVNYTQGTQKGGGTIPVDRSDPTAMLGIAENVDSFNFFSLGYGGEVILYFENGIINGVGADIRVIETSFGSPNCDNYPEYVTAYASQDGNTWHELGTQCQDNETYELPIELTCAHYVKLVEASIPFGNDKTDGFDVDGVEAIHPSELGCPSNCEPVEINLIAAKHIDVGSVIISNDEENLYVTYNVEEPWMITETHLAVKNSEPEIPQNKKGNPTLGKFEFKMTHDPTVNEYTYKIPLTELGENLVIATHAVVIKYENEEIIQIETAWGEGERFVEKGNWAMYFEYKIQDCNPPEPVCEEEILWQIGNEELNPLNNTVDEFNYPEAGLGSIVPPFTNPFIIGNSSDADFPWNSNYDRGYATDLNVEFEYLGSTVDTMLTVSWSPGKSATETKEIYLNGDFIATFTETGHADSNFWNSMPVYKEEMILELEKGQHTLTFLHTQGDGTLWDYVRLETICPEEE